MESEIPMSPLYSLPKKPRREIERVQSICEQTTQIKHTTTTSITNKLLSSLSFTTMTKLPSKQQQNLTNFSTVSLFSPKLSIYILATCVTLFIIFQIQSLHTSSPSSFIHHWQWPPPPPNCTIENLEPAMAEKLRQAVTFLPLKDLRYSDTALQGHTWFMSSMYDTHEEGEVQYQHFPSESSKGRLLCLLGHDTHDGARNSYALAWPETLPYNATLKEGLTFVSYNHYNYDNIWHGLSALVPFVAWHRKYNGCRVTPDRWILYHWGEVRVRMGVWLETLMEATFGGSIFIEKFDEIGEDEPVCFEEAVVMRHNEGGMSRDTRMEAYDLMRCKARGYCNLSIEENTKGLEGIGMTMFMRSGARSFKNESIVVGIFERECAKVDGCRLMVSHSDNLTFCEQVKVMSLTDILVSPHGAQLTNMFLMDRNSSVMEFFPKGWLKLAGVGQFVFHWIASWSGMRHQGAWRDPDGEYCPYPEDGRRCMSIYKSGRIGYNETFFAEWARKVLSEVKERKMEEAAADSNKNTITSDSFSSECACT